MKTLKPTAARKIVLFSILITLAAILKMIDSAFIFGITFNFASIFILLMISLFTRRLAFPTVVGIYMITALFTEFPMWTTIIPILEILFISWLRQSKLKMNLFIYDLLFWIIIGGPIGFIIFSHFTSSQLIDVTIPFLLIFYITNGLFNALIADILLTYVPFQRLLNPNRPQEFLVNLYQIVFHIVTIAVTLPFLMNVFLNSLNAYDAAQTTSKQLANNSANNIETKLSEWDENDIQRLKLNGLIQIGYLDSLLKKSSNAEEAFYMVITDQDQKVLASNDKSISYQQKYDWKMTNKNQEISKDFYESIPPGSSNDFELTKWAAGNLIYERSIESADVNLYIHFPIHNFQMQIFHDLMKQFRFILFFVAASILLALAFNRSFVNTLNRLSEATTGLPRKLEQMDTINWPKTSITEMRVVIDNFKHMSKKVTKMFQEIHSMNRKLEDQAKTLKKSEEELYNLAYYDPLTKLPNRLHFQRHLSKLIGISNKQKDIIAVMFLDLNRFKQINDTLGHLAGDLLLQKVSKRLLTLKTNNREVFRLGGDEFVIVVDKVNKQDIEDETQRVLSLLSKPVTLKGNTLYMSGSVGVSLFPEDGGDIDSLVKNADIAMYSSKEQGGNRANFFKRTMEDSFSERMLLDHGLHGALLEKQFEMYYQPKINSKTKKISGMEALIRWHHPQLGIVSPGKFIPLAEELGLIINIDEWGIFEACKQNKEWQDQGFPNIPVAVNLSAKHFHQDNLISFLEQVLQKSGLEAKYLNIEITESLFIKEMDDVIQKIRKIKNMGISVSIDDFGIGFSSLNHLINLPIQEVKLDQEFIRDIDKDKKKETIVKMIVSLAHSLDLNVVAEGVETEEELDYILRMECDELQGYYYSKPLNKAQFETFLQVNS